MSITIQFIIFVFLAVPFSLFIHELGHALTSLLFGAHDVTVRIGKGNCLYKLKRTRFSLIIHMNVFIHYMTEYKRNKPFTKREQLMIVLMGPMSNGIIGYCSYILYKDNTLLSFFLFCALFNWWLMITNLIPFKIGQKSSDGYTIYTLLFKS